MEYHFQRRRGRQRAHAPCVIFYSAQNFLVIISGGEPVNPPALNTALCIRAVNTITHECELIAGNTEDAEVVELALECIQ